MQLFWSVFGLFSDRSRGTPAGFPRPPGGSPSPSKSPPEGGKSTPQGAGACRPPVSPSGSPSTPLGHPYGVPPASPAPPPVPVRQWKGLASEARRGGSPGEGLEKIKVVAPIAAARPPAVEMWGRPGSRWAGVGAAGGQPPGLSTGCPCLCPRAAKRRPVAQRSPHLHCPGVQLGPLWGPICPPSGGQTVPDRPSWSGSRPAFS